MFAVRKHCASKSRQNVRYARNFKKFNTTDFLDDLSQLPWEDVAMHDDPNTCYRVWRSYYMQVLDRHAPLRRMRVPANYLPWINSNIKELMRMRDFHKKRAAKYNSQTHWGKYKPILDSISSYNLQSDLDRLQRWSLDRGMAFNKSKCKVMNISRKKSLIREAVYTIDNQSLDCVPFIMDLGVTVSNDLS
jgi:hypothetical protein